MKLQHLLVVLTVVNLALVAIAIRQVEAAGAESVAPVLRGRALEIVDAAGRVRASITVIPADPSYRMPDGSSGYPETVLLRLVNAKGRPNIKIAATDAGSGVLAGADGDATYVQVLAEGASSTIKLAGGDGRVTILKP
jgi:hypothetical protein